MGNIQAADGVKTVSTPQSIVRKDTTKTTSYTPFTFRTTQTHNDGDIETVRTDSKLGHYVDAEYHYSARFWGEPQKTLIAETKVSYDGKILERKEFDGDKYVIKNPQGQILEEGELYSDYKKVYEYDEKGNRTKMTMPYQDYAEIYEYDEKNRLIYKRNEAKLDFGSPLHERYTYDDKNNLVQTRTEYGAVLEVTDFEYDENGNKIKESIDNTGEKDTFKADGTPDVIKEYEYDEQNRLLKQTTTAAHFIDTESYQYDGNGRYVKVAKEHNDLENDSNDKLVTNNFKYHTNGNLAQQNDSTYRNGVLRKTFEATFEPNGKPIHEVSEKILQPDKKIHSWESSFGYGSPNKTTLYLDEERHTVKIKQIKRDFR